MEKEQILKNIMNEIQNDKNKQIKYYNKIYELLNSDACQLINDNEIYTHSGFHLEKSTFS